MMRNLMKKTTVLLLTLAMLALTACGGTVTLASYQGEAEGLMEEINANNTASAEVDWEDSDAVDKYVKETKAIYEKLKKLKAPEEAAAAQEKMSEGAEKMLEYLDRLPAYLEMEKAADADADAIEAERMELLGLYSQGISAISEGYAMVQDVANTAADAEEVEDTAADTEADTEELEDAADAEADAEEVEDAAADTEGEANTEDSADNTENAQAEGEDNGVEEE